ncbi:MAG: S-methyl-5'-thioadenosine phosphorylase [Candidatus Binatia bacterium]
MKTSRASTRGTRGPVVGIIGGTGLQAIEGMTGIDRQRIDTPFGRPSDTVVCGTLDGVRVAFVSRHGPGHRISPSQLNFRANIFALKVLGVEWLISVSSVGSLREEIPPGMIVLPEQFFDRTAGRPSSFFDDGVVAHVSFADPTCQALGKVLYGAAQSQGLPVRRGGTYLCMEGPQFSTRAESHVYRQWGMDIIGMTNLPEAKLAREAEMCFATLALVTDYDCWRVSEPEVNIGTVQDVMRRNLANAIAVIRTALPSLRPPRRCPCANALAASIVTDPAAIPPATRHTLAPLLGRYVPGGEL